MNLLADDRWISGKAPLKQAPRKKHHGLPLRLVLSLSKGPPEHRRNAEERKEIGRSSRTLHYFRQFTVHARDDPPVAAHRRHVFKAVSLAAPISVVAGGDGVEAIAACGLTEVIVEHDQVAGIAKRQRPQKHSTHNREQ